MKLLPHVMRNINEFNIPTENSQGYEILSLWCKSHTHV